MAGNGYTPEPPWSKADHGYLGEQAMTEGSGPLWLRVVILAWSRNVPSGHVNFKRGELLELLGTDGGQLGKAIKSAVKRRWLADGSCTTCLIVPRYTIRYDNGHPEPCPVHTHPVTPSALKVVKN
jgi:hypothetical protein